MTEKSTYTEPIRIDSSPIKNPMKLLEEADNDLFPLRRHPDFTKVRAKIGEAICSRHKFPKFGQVKNDPVIMRMIADSGQNLDNLWRIYFDKR